MRTLVSITLLSLAISATAALAQTPSKMSADDKKAISKSCSDQANAKGLHGKDRKKFRSACKHAGGKAQ